MTWRIVYSALHREGKPVAFMNPPGGIFTYVCGLVMHKNPSDEAKATALIEFHDRRSGSRLHVAEDR